MVYSNPLYNLTNQGFFHCSAVEGHRSPVGFLWTNVFKLHKLGGWSWWFVESVKTTAILLVVWRPCPLFGTSYSMTKR